jgi:hypothetical protein
MLTDWTAAAQAQLAGGLVRPGILLRVATSPFIRLWGGVGDLQIITDLVEDTAPAIYSGVGEVLSMPALSQLVNGQADRVDFSLTGSAITGEVAAIASTEASDIRNVSVNVGFLVFDDAWQILSPTAWLWDGIADSLKVDRNPGDGSGAVRSLTLSVGSVMTGRRRPSPNFWTDPDQRRRSADDAYCSLVKTYQVGTTKVWPE